jgi:hypothetical protein
LASFVDPIGEATRILAEAEQRSIVLRLLGGVAIHLRCPSASHRTLARNYVDMDFIGYSKQSAAISQLFKALGYVARDDPEGDLAHLHNPLVSHILSI